MVSDHPRFKAAVVVVGLRYSFASFQDGYYRLGICV